MYNHASYDENFKISIFGQKFPQSKKGVVKNRISPTRNVVNYFLWSHGTLMVTFVAKSACWILFWGSVQKSVGL